MACALEFTRIHMENFAKIVGTETVKSVGRVAKTQQNVLKTKNIVNGY